MESKRIKRISLLIRIGLIFVFLWAAIFTTFYPERFVHFMPEFVSILMPREMALLFFSFYEVLLCIFLATGKKTFYSGILAALTMAAITLTNYQELDTLFRNVSIFFSALALAFTDEVPTRLKKLLG